MNSQTSGKFGTAPVFLTAISTILGAIMFLRFGFATAHVGVLGVFAIILLGHLVTIPTAMAIAEIATNQKVEGGGEYYIISRSFGLTVGGAIGLSLFFSQAISTAFYVIAFAESFRPILPWLAESWGIQINDLRLISIPAMLALSALILTKGANMGMKVLYVVVSVLLLSLVFFFLGSPMDAAGGDMDFLTRRVSPSEPFFYVFAICFPAFTGMTAGVGLSGDLENPRKSIPLGTLAATLAGMVVYVLVALKLGYSATPEALDADPLIMSQISVWGPIIPIGLACATFSSAVGSILVAPRTLQAIGGDDLIPARALNRWLARGKGERGEPFHASLVACAIAIVFVALGDVNSVAEIISMFFMMTYGSICMISFLEHFAADPSYRPTFNSRWYVSAFGAMACLWLMFKMNTLVAALALMIMGGIYLIISFTNPDKTGLAAIFQGVIFQISRQLQIFLQKTQQKKYTLNWRPSVVCVSSDTFQRSSALEILRWMSHHHGFGTYIHFLKGYLSRATKGESDDAMGRLLRLARAGNSRVFVDTLVSPSETSAISQVIQLPGVSGHENNGLLMEFSKLNPVNLEAIVSNEPLVVANRFDLYVLGSSERKFGYRQEIHIWLTRQDDENANLMILLGFILLGDPEWRRGTVKIFALYSEKQLHEEEDRLRAQILAGRLPISQQNIQMIPTEAGIDHRTLINAMSEEADLVIMGFRHELIKHQGKELFLGYDQVGDILFVRAASQKILATTEEIDDVNKG